MVEGGSSSFWLRPPYFHANTTQQVFCNFKKLLDYVSFETCESDAIQVVVEGAEILLSKMGIQLIQQIQKKYPLSKFDFVASDDERALESLERGQVHIAIVTSDVSADSRFTVKVIGQTSFQTFAGLGHPLYGAAKSKKEVSIDEVLKHSFVSPSNPLLGKVGAKQSLDGWRDDQFPRRVAYQTSSLKILEDLLVGGHAIAYLPDYFAEKLKVEALKISGCPYSCHQKIKLVVRKKILLDG